MPNTKRSRRPSDCSGPARVTRRPRPSGRAPPSHCSVGLAQAAQARAQEAVVAAGEAGCRGRRCEGGCRRGESGWSRGRDGDQPGRHRADARRDGHRGYPRQPPAPRRRGTPSHAAARGRRRRAGVCHERPHHAGTLATPVCLVNAPCVGRAAGGGDQFGRVAWRVMAAGFHVR
jgi:hypothetical protein